MNQKESQTKEVIEESSYLGIKYKRYSDDVKKDRRGTVLILDQNSSKPIRKIPGFPSIPRVYKLEKGIKRIFNYRPFYVEEKIDGYNCRIILYNNQILAITRGGFICPFTTEWANLLMKKYGFDKFFEKFPEYILCAEAIGDNPYNNQRDPLVGPGLHFYIFEIMRADGKFLPVPVRYKLIEQFNLPTVRLFGRLSMYQIDKLYKILKDLNDNQREGVVIKSPSCKKVMKFVTPRSDLNDVKDNLIIAFDLHPGFFTNRLLRASMFIEEFKLDKDKYAYLIGKTFLEGYKKVEEAEECHEDFKIYIEKPDTWTMLKDILEQNIKVKVKETKSVKLKGTEMLEITFQKIYKKSTHRYHRIKEGYDYRD